MPNPTTFTLSLRYHDFGPDGQFHPASYIRAMLQAALEAAGPGNTPEPGLDDIGWLHLIRDIGLQIAAPITLGEAVGIETWLAGWPPDWRRYFRFKRAGSDAEAATGFVHVFAEESNEEASESKEANSDVIAEPDDGDDLPAWDGLVVGPPTPPDRAMRAAWRAGWPYLDQGGYLDLARLTEVAMDMDSRAAEILGWTEATDEANGVTWQVAEHRLESFDSVAAGDVLDITNYIGDVIDTALVRHTLVERKQDGMVVLVARLRTRWNCVAAATGQPHAIPDDWFFDLADHIARLP